MPWPYLEMPSSMLAKVQSRSSWRVTHCLCNVVNDYGTVGIPIVHRSKGLISLLSRRIPYFKFDCRGIIERDGLSEERSSDGGLSIVIKLILHGLLGTGHEAFSPIGQDSLQTRLDKSKYQRALGNNRLVGFKILPGRARNLPFQQPIHLPYKSIEDI